MLNVCITNICFFVCRNNNNSSRGKRAIDSALHQNCCVETLREDTKLRVGTGHLADGVDKGSSPQAAVLLFVANTQERKEEKKKKTF